MKRDRLLVTTILGFIFGFISYLLAKGAGPLTCVIAWSIILYGALLGFIIGISGFKFNFVIHGIVIGAIVYLPAALPSDQFVFIWLQGMVYGAFIEIISHIVIREKVAETSTT